MGGGGGEGGGQDLLSLLSRNLWLVQRPCSHQACPNTATPSHIQDPFQHSTSQEPEVHRHEMLGINPEGTLPPPNHATPHFSAFPVFRYQPHRYTTTSKPCNTTPVLFQCSVINPTGTLPPPNHATPHFSAFPVFRYQPHQYTTTSKPCNTTLQCFSSVQLSTPPVHYHLQTMQHHTSAFPVFSYQPHRYTTTSKPGNTTLQCFSSVQVSTPPVHYHLQTMQQVSTLQCCSGVQVLTHPMHDATYLYEAPKQSQTAWHTPRIAFRHLPQTLPDLVTLLKGHSFSLHSCPPMRSAPSKRFGY